MKSVLGWHLTSGDCLSHDDGRRIVVGETLKVDGKIVPCERGLHASPTISDALRYRPVTTTHLWRDRLSGEVVPHGEPIDKWAASERTALWCLHGKALDALFRRFARWCAANVAARWPAAMDRPTVARWLVGGDEADRAAASSAASAAAWDAASSAASSAAWAAASDAASAAARAAASAAASAAAWDASGDAARRKRTHTLDRWARIAHRGDRLPRRITLGEIEPKSRAVLRAALKGTR